MLEDLLEDEHVVAVHEFDHPPYPHIDTSSWRSPAKADRILASIHDYIDTLAIEDDFGADHGKRRVWRGQKRENELKVALENNPLRINMYDTIFSRLFKLSLGATGEVGRYLVGIRWNLLNDFPKDYNSFVFEDRLAYAHRIKQRAYDILVKVGELT